MGPRLEYRENTSERKKFYVFDKNYKLLKPYFKQYIHEKFWIEYYPARAYYVVEFTGPPTSQTMRAWIYEGGFKEISIEELPESIRANPSIVLESI